ncbi:MAG: hypothetical protein H7Z40_01070, partial [Phycisphaerae bacterium]|nr:hypothetical protein [Gemmatimonadaceae bacterium]
KRVLDITVACLSTIDSAFLDQGSTALGIPAVVVWTKDGPYAQVSSALIAVRDAQTAHFARTGKYSLDLTTLRLPATPDEVKISLEATATGWTATAWVDRPLSPRCKVFDGDVGQRIAVANGTVRCG